MSNKWKINYGETEKTKGVKEWREVVRSEMVLDHPTVGNGSAKQAAIVTLPAATLPTGRKHLPMKETLILPVLRCTSLQSAWLHLQHWGEGKQPLWFKNMLSCLFLKPIFNLGNPTIAKMVSIGLQRRAKPVVTAAVWVVFMICEHHWFKTDYEMSGNPVYLSLNITGRSQSGEECVEECEFCPFTHHILL